MVATVRVTEDALPLMLALDRAGGMPVSRREADEFADMDEQDLDEAIKDELL
jgi:hypothetical protein